jgi:hypothetical protein
MPQHRDKIAKRCRCDIRWDWHGNIILLSSKKESSTQVMNMKCNKGHEMIKVWNNELRLWICPTCKSMKEDYVYAGIKHGKDKRAKKM